jgi:hypothetical protein
MPRNNVTVFLYKFVLEPKMEIKEQDQMHKPPSYIHVIQQLTTLRQNLNACHNFKMSIGCSPSRHRSTLLTFPIQLLVFVALVPFRQLFYSWRNTWLETFKAQA